MTTETTTTTTTVAPVKAAVKKAVKKVAPVAAVAKATKKAVKTEAPKAEAPAKVEKKGLTKPQLRILACLAKGVTLTRAEISEKAPVDNAFCTEYLGSLKDEVRLKNDIKLPSLLTLKMIKVAIHEVEGKNIAQYTITAVGKQAHEKALKAAKE